jgi:hypothetical protein
MRVKAMTAEEWWFLWCAGCGSTTGRGGGGWRGSLSFRLNSVLFGYETYSSPTKLGTMSKSKT